MAGYTGLDRTENTCTAELRPGGLMCNGLKGHTGPHAAYDPKLNVVLTWEREHGRAT